MVNIAINSAANTFYHISLSQVDIKIIHRKIKIDKKRMNNYGILASYYERAPTVLRFEPLLKATKDQLDKTVDALDATFSKGILSLSAAFG